MFLCKKGGQDFNIMFPLPWQHSTNAKNYLNFSSIDNASPKTLRSNLLWYMRMLWRGRRRSLGWFEKKYLHYYVSSFQRKMTIAWKYCFIVLKIMHTLYAYLMNCIWFINKLELVSSNIGKLLSSLIPLIRKLQTNLKILPLR